MVSNKMFVFFMFESLIHSSNNIFKVNIVILKIPHTTKYFMKFLFFFINLSQSNFLNCYKFFIVTKSLNTACAPAEMKQNLLH